ncbi:MULTISPECIES: hypothetical protein [unclassified Rhodanobacter]|uniref:hypothetical protein n=1 Tax=unclassified Rhodanobacter TaxID=2621553 RepID=UPI001BDE126C|nr:MULTISPECIES: hypothetical protein [unclassified Rhodanobacter]MBT2143438.1 hypothetical protein [Rhodanobacter sp. LX-99]MBT2147488.1 hypothetical protein [Rhodanobacter sp. LX-100]
MKDHATNAGASGNEAARPLARLFATTLSAQTVEMATSPENLLLTKINSDPEADQFDFG